MKYIYKNKQLNYHLSLKYFPNYNLFYTISKNKNTKNQILLYSYKTNKFITSQKHKKYKLKITQKYQQTPYKNIPL